MTISSMFHVRRFILQATSPVMIASGGDDPFLDNLLVRDADDPGNDLGRSAACRI